MAFRLRGAPVVGDVDVAAAAAAPAAVRPKLLARRGGGPLHTGASTAVAVSVEGHLALGKGKGL